MHWLSQSKTYGRYQDFAAPSPPRDWHGGPFPTHGELAQGLSLTMGLTRTASPLRFFLTAVTRNLAIARFLCENSGPFWTTTRVLPAKYKINDESPIEIRKFAKKIVHILGKLSFHWLFIVRNCYTSEMMIKTADCAMLVRARYTRGSIIVKTIVLLTWDCMFYCTQDFGSGCFCIIPKWSLPFIYFFLCYW